MNTFEEVQSFLYSQLPTYQNQGPTALNYKLDKIGRMVDAVGNPHEQYKTIHVAGTNGKGSVSHHLAAILHAAGYRVGLYTSPHLKRFTERIRVDGLEISQAYVVNFVNGHMPLIEEEKPSFFEITVLMAFDYFASQNVNVAVVEVGLGGRLDSTNIIKPELSIITNIGYDHQYILGDTLAEIAAEKAGIIKHHVPVVVGEKQEEVSEVFESKAKEFQSDVFFASDNPIMDEDISYKAINKRTVRKAIDVLVQRGWVVKDEHIIAGFKALDTTWTLNGRWQVISENPLIVCDVAHNQDGIRHVLTHISKCKYTSLTFVLGMVKDKNIYEILSLFPSGAEYVFCQASNDRAVDAEELLQVASSQGKNGQVIKDVNEAIRAVKKSTNEDGLIYIGGSTFVVAEIDDL